MRWDVEVQPDSFHEVRGDRLEIDHGVLVFYDDADRVLIAYAQGQWITVSLSEAGGAS